MLTVLLSGHGVKIRCFSTRFRPSGVPYRAAGRVTPRSAAAARARGVGAIRWTARRLIAADGVVLSGVSHREAALDERQLVARDGRLRLKAFVVLEQDC